MYESDLSEAGDPDLVTFHLVRMTTLKARAFLDIDVEHPETEVLRLNVLFSQISCQTRNEKKRLVGEFLEIIEDQHCRLGFRIQACNILGARKTELGLSKPEFITARIRKVLEREFLESKRTGPFSVRKELRLRVPGPMAFCFLEALLLTLLRIDPVGMHEFVWRATGLVQDDERKHDLTELLKRAQKIHPDKI